MRVSQVEVPKVTRPGTALGSNQKLTMLINTWVDTYFINTYISFNVYIYVLRCSFKHLDSSSDIYSNWMVY